MVQREREAEGDEFRDKESFVTQAYKDQMAEVRRAEEDERKREGVYYMTIPLTPN
jgi:coiled-coil domain-containing protein 55